MIAKETEKLGDVIAEVAIMGISIFIDDFCENSSKVDLIFVDKIVYERLIVLSNKLEFRATSNCKSELPLFVGNTLDNIDSKTTKIFIRNSEVVKSDLLSEDCEPTKNFEVGLLDVKNKRFERKIIEISMFLEV